MGNGLTLLKTIIFYQETILLHGFSNKRNYQFFDILSIYCNSCPWWIYIIYSNPHMVSSKTGLAFLFQQT